MSSKFTKKLYVAKGIYHIYNRGINKDKIFIEDQDYKVFLNCLKLYLLSKKEILENINVLNLPLEIKKEKETSINLLKNFYQKINLLAFVLMPNHFHFLIQQEGRFEIKFFIKSLLTKYAMYFNKKYNRIGPLFQGRYRAIFIDKEEYLIHISRYIHLNPKKILKNNEILINYPWSSYPFYVKNYHAGWLRKDIILSYFKKNNSFSPFSYQNFVEGYKDNEESLMIKERYFIDF